MKRFVPNLARQTYDKCFNPVSIDQQLDIGHVCADQLTLEYKLRGIVCHMGATPAVGHYVADTQACDGGWTHFNDSVATKLETQDLQSDMRQKNVYLAVYSL